eukprot:2089250-Lingulodinium_polyedra.AAC.1
MISGFKARGRRRMELVRGLRSTFWARFGCVWRLREVEGHGIKVAIRVGDKGGCKNNIGRAAHAENGA